MEKIIRKTPKWIYFELEHENTDDKGIEISREQREIDGRGTGDLHYRWCNHVESKQC